MGKSTPSPPPQPDPVKVAQAQTGSNVTTGISNSYLQNANQYGPYGSTEFAVNNWNDVYDPSTKTTYKVPTFNQTTTLSPEQQGLLNQQNQLQAGLNNIAIDQEGRIGDVLGSPIQAPSGELNRTLNPEDWASGRQRVEDALMQRLNPQLERDKSQLDTKLANEGFTRGSEGYNQAIDENARATNDARLAAISQAGQEQQRLAAMDIGSAQFENQAYGQQLQTDLSLRNQPINEVSALMSGGQVSLPQYQGYQSGQVAGTPIGDYYMQNAAMANANYQAQLQSSAQQQAGLYGGIGSVLGAGLYGFARSDRRVKTAIHRIGKWFNGLPLYLFSYIDDPAKMVRMGFMAQDVEKVMPAAVVTINGTKWVNYELARH